MWLYAIGRIFSCVNSSLYKKAFQILIYSYHSGAKNQWLSSIFTVNEEKVDFPQNSQLIRYQYPLKMFSCSNRILIYFHRYFVSDPTLFLFSKAVLLRIGFNHAKQYRKRTRYTIYKMPLFIILSLIKIVARLEFLKHHEEAIAAYGFAEIFRKFGNLCK